MLQRVIAVVSNADWSTGTAVLEYGMGFSIAAMENFTQWLLVQIIFVLIIFLIAKRSAIIVLFNFSQRIFL